TGPTGTTGTNGRAGPGSLTFQSVAVSASSAECLGANGVDTHVTCPSTAGLPTNLTATVGPVPNGGATVTNLFAQLDANAAGSGNKVSVLDNGTDVFNCTVLSGTSTCSNGGAVNVVAGHYLQVQVTNLSGAS